MQCFNICRGALTPCASALHLREKHRHHELPGWLSSGRVALKTRKVTPSRRSRLVECRRGGTRRRRRPGSRAPVEDISTFGYRTDFRDVYKFGKLLGQGGYGTVNEIFEIETNRSFAVKRIPKQMNREHLCPLFVSRVRNEVDTLNLLAGSLNTAYLYGCYEDDDNVMLVFDVLGGGTLGDRVEQLQADHRLTEEEIARIAEGVLQMLTQCHAIGIVHRDIKPDNFLFSSTSPEAPLKAIDFGSATPYNPRYPPQDRIGTPVYMAPEVVKAGVNLRDPGYGFKADIWSAGVLFYLLLVGKWPFNGETGRILNAGLSSAEKMQTDAMVDQMLEKLEQQDLYQAVCEEELDFSPEAWEGRSPASLDFVRSMLQRDPMLRPSALEALEHSFLKQAKPGENADARLAVRNQVVQRLQRYGTYINLKRIALTEMVQFVPLCEDELSQIRAIFREVDTSGSGTVAIQTMLEAMSNSNFQLATEEVEQLLAVVDLNRDGSIQYNEWVAALTDWKRLQSSPEWEEWAHAAFDSLVKDVEAGMCGTELEGIIQSSAGADGGISSIFQDTMRLLDLNGDGRISFPEFMTMLTSGELELEAFSSRFDDSIDFDSLDESVDLQL